jgi:type IV pilus assembly protein PilW
MNRFHRSRGFSLVELMVAMALGLVIVGGVVSVMMANKRSYRTNVGLAQVQESARTAYELMARDVRQSGTTGCDSARRMSNMLNGNGTNWYETWEGVRGYDNATADSAVTIGTGTAQRVTGTDTLRLSGIDGRGFPVETHNATSGTIVLQTANSSATSLSSNDFLIICDFDHSTMFKAGAWDGSTRTIAYSAAGGNCGTSGMGFPTNCASSTGLVYTYSRNAWVGRLGAIDWYVGYNPRGGKSLYRMRLPSGGGGAPVAEEIVSNVTDMQISYGINGNDNIVTAADPLLATAADWAKVNSVFITLNIDSNDTNVATTTTNSGKLTRPYTYIITLRNRVS